jgi:hypothetical protein
MLQADRGEVKASRALIGEDARRQRDACEKALRLLNTLLVGERKQGARGRAAPNAARHP